MRILSRLLTAALAIAGTGFGQETPRIPFTFSAGTPGVSPSAVASDGTGLLRLPDTNLGAAGTLYLFIRNTGTRSYALGSFATSGAGFSTEADWKQIAAGGTALVTIGFRPGTTGLTTGALSFTLQAEGSDTFRLQFPLAASGLAPALSVSYIPPPGGNQLPVQPGTPVLLPPSPVRAPVTTVFVIANSGTAPGIVTSVSLASEVFELNSLPLLPGSIAPGSEIRFAVLFRPLAARTYSAVLTIAFGGVRQEYQLVAQGTSGSLSYAIATGNGEQPISPGGTLKLSDTLVNSTSEQVLLIVRNTGSADAPISSILTTGTEFVASLPRGLPLALQPGESLQIALTFKPASPGPRSTQLRIGESVFTLEGQGVGPQLKILVEDGSGSLAEAFNRETVPIPNTEVGDRRRFRILFQNSGTAPLSLRTVGVTGSAFAADATPALPLQLEPDQTIAVSVTFKPVETGAATGTVIVDGAVITLLGVGTAPPPLPPIVLSGLGGRTEALQQIPLGIRTSQPYPHTINGKLTISFRPDTPYDDPAVRFPEGRTILFAIPATRSAAVFQIQGKDAGAAAFLQTGSTAGLITVVVGELFVERVDLTPAAPPTASGSVLPQAPSIRQVRINRQSDASVSLLITGFATSRSLTSIRIEGLAATGAPIRTATVEADVERAFSAWYGTGESQLFGSQFTLSLTLTMAGDWRTVRGLAVTAGNTYGSSAPVEVSLAQQEF